MVQIVVRCTSPTCRSAIVLYRITRGALARMGWSMEMQPGDDVPSPYCPRCTL
jgi:hypothetical protein